MGPTTPAYRGLWATTPKRGRRRPARARGYGSHTVNVASITRRGAELAG